MSGGSLAASPAHGKQAEGGGVPDRNEMVRLGDIGLDDAALVDGESMGCAESPRPLLESTVTAHCHPAANETAAVPVTEVPHEVPASLVDEREALEPGPTLPASPEDFDRDSFFAVPYDTRPDAFPFTRRDFEAARDDPGVRDPARSDAVPSFDEFQPLGISAAPHAFAGARQTGVSLPQWDVVRHRLARVSTALIYIGFGWLLLVASALLWFRFVNPPFSSLTLAEVLGGRTVDQEWVPLAKISPALMRAVVASEDSRFCEHHGIDLEEVAAALSRTRNGAPRGASTISMQVTKNLFLWPAKNYVRKTIEIPLALLIEMLWPKRRIFEIYANTAEWGPGVFGIEAAARYHLGKSARDLNEQEAALLAVALPNPIKRVAGRPGPGTLRLARMLRPRMHAASIGCITEKRLGAKTTDAGARRIE